MLSARVRKLNSAEARKNGQYVLYWAQVNRRVESNHALSFALDQANELDLPVLFYEGLTCSFRQANDRFYTFLLERAGNRAALASARYRLRVSFAASPVGFRVGSIRVRSR